jgi:hypothetical protein
MVQAANGQRRRRPRRADARPRKGGTGRALPVEGGKHHPASADITLLRSGGANSDDASLFFLEPPLVGGRYRLLMRDLNLTVSFRDRIVATTHVLHR